MSYQYNLAGELKKITDPTNATINYNYDAGGRIVEVTGENNLVNNVSQYASNFAYRASGAVRDKDFGNAHSHMDYNARMLRATAVLSLVFPSALNPNLTMTWNYDYYADGRLRHAYDVADNRFDRLQEYDQVGRLQEAYSGREARGLTATTPADNPYRQSMQSDVWDNLTSKNGRFWRQSLSDTGTYINNRRQYWSYDAEGNQLGNDGKGHTYDVVGKQTQVMSATETVGGSGTGHPVQSGWEIAQSYDADGRTARRSETRRSEEYIGGGPQTNISETVTVTYYLYSSVLGAEVMELDGGGVKTKGYVYANGERLAKQEITAWFSAVWWQHANAGTNSWVEVSEAGVQRQEMDPMGAEVGTYDPYLNQLNPVYKDIHPLPQQLYLEGGDPFDYVSGYSLDGLPVTQSQLNRILDRLGIRGTTVTFDVYRVDAELRDHPELWWQYWADSFDVRLPDSMPSQGASQPQNTKILVSNAERTAYRGRIEEMLKNKDCADYIQQLFNEAKTQTGMPFGDILTTFDAMRFYWAKTDGAHGGYAYWEEMGTVRTADIMDTINTEKMGGSRANQMDRRAYLISETTQSFFGETMHHLSRGGRMYGDGEMANALNAILVRQGRDTAKVFSDRTGADVDNASRYWHPKVASKCPAPRR